jgi:hypothetical protein
VDCGGRIWVSRYAVAVRVDLSPEYVAERAGRPLYRWREPPLWEVFDSDGAFLGEVIMPPRSYPSYVCGDVVLAVQEGEYSEEYVPKLLLQRR